MTMTTTTKPHLSLLRTALWLCCLSVSTTTAEIFHVHNMNGDNPYIQNEQGQRFMAGSAGSSSGTTGVPVDDRGTLSSINATVNTCAATAFNSVCNVNSVINANDGNGVTMDIVVTCDLESQTAFDFRRATGCTCSANVKDAAGNPKNCFCNVCPFNFGNAPVSIECVDEFIVGECTSFDCSFACNGTCAFGCDESAVAQAECDFCQAGILAPTSAPTGPRDGSPNRGPTLGDSAAPGLYQGFFWTAIVGALFGMMLSVN